MIRYFLDLVVGIIVGLIPCLLARIYYYPNTLGMLLAYGIVFPCMLVAVYIFFRYKVTKEKPELELYMIGLIIGFVFQCGISYIVENYFPAGHLFYEIEGMEGFDMLGKGLEYAVIVIGVNKEVVCLSPIFLWLLSRKGRKCVDRKNIRKAEVLGVTYCYPIIGYMFMIAAMKELSVCLGGNKKIDNIPITVKMAWIMCLLVCVLLILLVFLWGKGKNISHMLIAYMGEAGGICVCVKWFGLSLPLEHLVALGGVIFLGAGIYKGLEKVFAKRE